MLGMFREKRARLAMAQVAAGIAEGVQVLSPVDRAATMAIANALLAVAAERWGREVVESPKTLSAGAAASIVVMLSEAHAKCLEALKAQRDRGMGDLTYSQAMRQLRATEAAMGAVGRRFLDPGGVRAVTDAWKALWTSRSKAPEAAEVLLRFTQMNGADALPRTASRNGPFEREEVVRLASTLPPMFQRKGPAPRPPAAPRPPGARARPPGASAPPARRVAPAGGARGRAGA